MGVISFNFLGMVFLQKVNYSALAEPDPCLNLPWITPNSQM